MKKRLISIALALCVLLSLFPMQAFAAWSEELDAQVIDLPIIAEGEETPSPQGLGQPVSFFGLVANAAGYSYSYEGQETIQFREEAIILDPATGGYLTEEPASNGVLQMLNEDGDVVASSETISYYDKNWASGYYYAEYVYFYSNEAQDLTQLPAGTYTLQLVTGSNAEDVYPCEGAMMIVDSESLLLRNAYASLYIGKSTADISLELYGFKTEEELSALGFHLLDEDGEVVGSTSGNYRDVYVNTSYGAPYWHLDAELVMVDDYVLLEGISYTLQVAYTGDKDLYDGIGYATRRAYEPNIEVTDLTALDAQTGLVELTFENWVPNMEYTVNVSGNNGSNLGSYVGTIPESGTIEMQLGQNGISTPMTALDSYLYVQVSQEGYYASGNDFYNPYYNMGSSSGSAHASFAPYYVSTASPTVEFTLTGRNYTAYLGNGDVVTMQDRNGNVVATCNQLTELYYEDGYFEVKGIFYFAEALTRGTYYIYLNGVEADTIYATANLGISMSVPMRDYDDDIFYANFGIIPVRVYGVNSSGKGKFTVQKITVNNEGTEDESTELTPVLVTDWITGIPGEYFNYLYYNYSFTAEEFAVLEPGASYALCFEDANGQQRNTTMGTYDSTKTKLDLSDLNQCYIRTSNSQIGDTSIPMELRFWNGTLRNLTEDDLDVVTDLILYNRDTETVLTVTGYANNGWDPDSNNYNYYYLDLELSGALTAGYWYVGFLDGEEVLRSFSLEEPETDVDTTPYLYNNRYTANMGYLMGEHLPDGNYTAKLYDGYTCLSETAFPLTWENYSQYQQRLYYPDSAVAALTAGSYEMRVFLGEVLLGAVTLTVVDTSKPIVTLYDTNYRTSRINYSGFYAFEVANSGVYTKLRTAESLEELEQTSYDSLGYGYTLNDLETAGERTVYVQLQTADGTQESDVLTFSFWYMGDNDQIDVTVHEDLQGIYGGNNISFVLGSESKYASAWLEMFFRNGDTTEIPMNYTGFGPLPEAFPPEEEEPIILESSHPYAPNTDETWTYTVNGANSLKVTFSGDTYFEHDSDYLYVYAGAVAEENCLYRYTGWNLADNTLTIPGDTVTLRLVSDDYSYSDAYGFAVTSIKGSDVVIEMEQILLESLHPYENNADETKTWTYTVPGAEKIAVTFSSMTQFESGWDYLYIYTGELAEENYFNKYSGTDLAGKTLTLPGDTITMYIDSDGSVNYYGFAITSIVDPDAPVAEPAPEQPAEPAVPEVALPASNHPFGNATGYAAEIFTHTVEDADALAVTFSEETALTAGGNLWIYAGTAASGEPHKLYDYTNIDELSGKTIVIPGDSITILLEAYSTSFYGFDVTAIEATKPESEEPEDTTGYLHLFTAGPYSVFDHNDYLGYIDDLETIRFYLTDEDGDVISEVVERTLIFGSPDEVILPWYSDYDTVYVADDAFTVYGYATPNSTITVTDTSAEGTTSGTTTSNVNGYFSLELTELVEGQHYINVSDDSGITSSADGYFVVDSVAPVISSAEFSFGTTGTATLTWVCNDYDVDRFALFKTNTITGATSVIDNWIYDYSAGTVSYTVAASEDDGNVFTIRAYDYAGNMGERTISTADQIPPTAPETLTVTAVTTTSVSLQWSEGTDNKEVLGYDVYVDGTPIRQATSALSYTVTGLEMGKSYTFAVKTRDKATNTSPFSPEVEATTVTIAVAADVEPSYVVDLFPNKYIPVGYTVSANAEGYTVSIQEAWMEYRAAGSEDDWITRYLSQDGTGSWYIGANTEDGFLDSGEYEMIFHVKDIYGAVTASSPATVVILSRDNEAPSAPGTPVAISHSTASITFSWTASTDNVGVTEYIIYCDGDPVATVDSETLTYTLNDLSMGEHKIGVQAADWRRNMSEVVSATLKTMSLEFDSVIDLESQNYVLEDQNGKAISVWAKFMPEEGYEPNITMAMEYKAANDNEWKRFSLSASATDGNYFTGNWDISGDDYGYLTPGKYHVRFAVTDGTNTACSSEQSVMLNAESNPPTVLIATPGVADTVRGKDLTLGAWAEDEDSAVEKVCFFYKEQSADEFIELGTAELYASDRFLLFWENAETLPSGNYAVKAEVYDVRGNKSESINYFTLDNDAPAVPTGMTATATSRYIHVMWDAGYVPSNDFWTFRIYRATEENGAYTQIDQFNSIGYYDGGTTAEAGETYYYYVTAVDDLGNESVPSEIVSATFVNDTESPMISDMLPRDDEPLRKEYTLQVIASDNYRLSTAIFYYRAVGTGQWIEIGRDTMTDIDSYHVFALDWDIPATITTKGQYEIRVEVYDSSYTDLAAEAGYTANAPAILERTVSIHPYFAPVAPEVSVTAGYKTANLTWTYSGSTETLSRFVVYQTDSTGANLEYVTTCAAGSSGKTTVTIPASGEQYFVVVASDVYGATAVSGVKTVTSESRETVPPVAVIMPTDLIAAKDVAFTFSGVNSTDNDVIASYTWDFGDGTTGTGSICEHVYTTAGEYTVKLTVADESGNSNTATATMTAYDITGADADHVLTTLKVVNAYEAETPAITGAEVKVTLKDESDTITFETSGITDENGTFVTVLPKEAVTVAVTANGYVATSRSVVIEGDENGTFSYTVGMTPMNVSMVDGSLSVEEMSYSDIVAAGIDVTDPDNNHVWKFAAELEFVAAPALPFDVPSVPLTGFYNSQGTFLGGTGWGWTTLSGGGGSGGGPGWALNVGIFPISESFLLVIYGEAHWLKEMYNVELIVINNSYVDDITDCKATLTLPKGMSLAAMTGKAQSPTIDIGTIPHKTPANDQAGIEKVNWYVRGDEEGEYYLSASVTGNNPEPFIKDFTTDKPVKVYAGSALKLYIRAEDIAYREEEYHVQFELKNVTNELDPNGIGKDLYNLSFGITGADQFRVTGLGDITMKQELTHEDFGDSMTQKVGTLRPGESITIDFYTTIWFNSILELVDMGPLDAGYYLTGVFVTTLEGSTTSIPYEIEIIPSSHGTFFEWLVDEAKDALEDGAIDFIEKEFLDEVPLLSTGKKLYEFFHVGDAASRCEVALDNGSFTSSDNLLRGGSRTFSLDRSAIKVYTDSTDYQISADGTRMIINGDANIYVEGALPGEAAMTVTTYVIDDNGEEVPHVYTMNYVVSDEVVEAEGLILQAPAVGVTEGKTAVPLAGEEKQITFPYVLVDANGNYLTQAENAQWTVTGEGTDGLSIENGVLTIASHAKGGDYTVTLTVGEETASQTITLTRDPSVPAIVKLFRDGLELGENDLLAADGNHETYTYDAVVLDQYGVVFEYELEWTADGTITGVSAENGIITLTETAESGVLTLTVNAGDKSDSVVISVVNSEQLTVSCDDASETAATIVLTNESSVTAAVQCVAAVYDNNGRMVTCNTVCTELAAGEDAEITLTYAETDEAKTLRAFVMNSNTCNPLTEVWETTVQE